MRYAETIEWTRTGLAVGLFFMMAMLSLLGPAGAVAQGSDWRAALEGEKAKNAERLAVIEQRGAPIAAKLREVTRATERHNANQCTYPADQPEACAWYENERVQLDTESQSLRAQLIPLVDELERLQARNAEIERRLHCAQPPIPCSSNSDCLCSQSCAAFPDGRRSDMGICQPRS